MDGASIHDIPKNVLALAFAKCDDKALSRCELVCKRWKEVIHENPALLARVRNPREVGRWRWFCSQPDFKETQLRLKGHQVCAFRPIQLDGHSYILALGVRKAFRKSKMALMLLSAMSGGGTRTATKWTWPTTAAFTDERNSTVVCSQIGAGGLHSLSRITFTPARRGWALKIEPITSGQTAFGDQTRVEWTTEGRFLTCNSKENGLKHELQLWRHGTQLRSTQISDAQVSLCSAGAAAASSTGTFRLYGPEHIDDAALPPMQTLQRFVQGRHTLKQFQAIENGIVCLLATPDVSDRLVRYSREGKVKWVIEPKVLPLDTSLFGQPDLRHIHDFGALSLAGELVVVLRTAESSRDAFGNRMAEAASIFPTDRSRVRHIGSFPFGGNRFAFVTGKEPGLLVTNSTSKGMYLIQSKRHGK